MLGKPIDLCEKNSNLYHYLTEIRKLFYFLLKKIPEKNNLTINTNQNNLLQIFSKLKNIIEKMTIHLNYFNCSENQVYVSDEYIINTFLDKIQENINHNYNIVNIADLFNNTSTQLNIFEINFFFPIKIPLTNRVPLNKININQINKNIQPKLNDQEIINYINTINLKNISFNKKTTTEIICDKDNIIPVYELQINNFVIEIKQKKTNIISIKDITIKSKLKGFENTKLMLKIKERFFDEINFFSKKIQRNENSMMILLKLIINYIYDYENIFYIKCFACKKNSKYSYVDKAFFPPFIKKNREIFFGNYFSNERNKFFHPQCI